MQFGGPPGAGMHNDFVIGGHQNYEPLSPLDQFLPEPSAVDRLAALVDEDAAKRVKHYDDVMGTIKQADEITKTLRQVERYTDYAHMSAYPLLSPCLSGYADDARLYSHSNTTG